MAELERCDFKLWSKTLPRVANAMASVQFSDAEMVVDETNMTDIYWIAKVGKMTNE